MQVQNLFKKSLIFIALLLFCFALIPPLTKSVKAADGTTLRQLTAQVPSCSIGTGVAFDGTNLYLSCWYSNNLYSVSPTDGHLVATIPVNNVNGMGALAYDASQQAFWACDHANEDILLITISNGAGNAVHKFHPTGGCIDGLAYDGTDQTLFASGDVAQTVYHYHTDGQLIDSRNVSNSLGGCGNSGIAVGGKYLFLSNDGCSQIYVVDKTQNDAIPQLFANYPARLEDLECDDVTFRSEGKTAIWSKDAYDSVLNAFELNTGDCGYGGLPPSQGGKFVYVALGDSYQSGEGAGNSILNTQDYLSKAYENLPTNPENTYTDQVLTHDGDSCHRSLVNYAKLIRDRLKPGAQVNLIDVTCSGATIEPGANSEHTVVGTAGSPTVNPASQIAIATEKLKSLGLTTNDVDLVTVGMGGNDAKFGDLIKACLLPNVTRRMIQMYPGSPLLAQLVANTDFLSNTLLNCQNADNWIFHIGGAISQLTDKELWAQQKALETFPKARVLQVNYPDILPQKKGAPSWCGGIRKEDLDYARSKAAQIDKIVSDTVHTTAQNDPLLELVNLENALGGNALCPSTADLALANGINETNFNTELSRLLNLDGHGDAVARSKLDTLGLDWNKYLDCLHTHYTHYINPFGNDCNTKAAWNQVEADGRDLLSYLNTQQDTILTNLVAPADNTGVGFDRSRGLFHPNAHGYSVIGCNVLAVYNGTNPSDCLTSPILTVDSVNGIPLGNAPISALQGSQIQVQIGGFAFNAPVHITFYSTPIDLGTVMSDSQGVVNTTITLPNDGAGVHTLELEGNTPGGTGIHKRIRVNYPGRPSGDGSYSTYLCGFTPNTDDTVAPENVDIIYYNDVFETVTPDENGCVFVELPLLDLENQTGTVDITARSQVTGKTVTTTIDPIPSVVGLWTTATKPAALVVSGANTTVTGRVHSNADITVQGSSNSFTAGTEYGTTLTVTGNYNTLPSSRKVAPGGLPLVWQIADYRPGGSIAKNAGANYHEINKTACSNGVWSVNAQAIPSGIVYVPCSVVITGSSVTINATIVAEGAIKFTGSNIIVDPGKNGSPALLTAAIGPDAIRIDGTNIKINGTTQALNGEAHITGEKGTYHCGIIAATITINGSGNNVPVDDQCRQP